jgi:cytochrome P450
MSTAVATQDRTSAPTYAVDLYARAALLDPYPHYKAIRALGPAVWLPKRKLWAIGGYDDVKTALRADQALVSGKGIAANRIVNGMDAPTTLTSDGETHIRRRTTLIKPLSPAALKELQARMESTADELVTRLRAQASFDAVSDFAVHLPVSIVGELVGLKPEGRKNLLHWAAATFDALGPLNFRFIRALPSLLDLRRYATNLTRENVMPGSWADGVFEAAERGQIAPQEAHAMIIDYVAPSLDTTILATGYMVWLLAKHPEAFDAVKQDPSLITNTVHEAVRLASPIRGFTRYAATDFEIGSTVIPKDARVLVLYASGNRDERKYAEPDKFDVTRGARDHVAWGHGPHVCAGMHLARLEMECLLRALTRQVACIEVGEPAPILNNILQGFKTLPARFH